MLVITLLALCGPALAGPKSEEPATADVETWGSVRELDNRDGWRDLAWGKAPPPGMTIVERAPGPVVTYLSPADAAAAEGGTLVVGAFPLAGVRYTFWKDQFYRVSLETSGHATTNGLLQALKYKYGLPTHSTQWPTSLIWQGRLVRLQFVTDATSASGTITYTFLPLEQRADRAAADAIKDAAREL